MPRECFWVKVQRSSGHLQCLINLLPFNVREMPLQYEWYLSRATEDRFFTTSMWVQTNALSSHNGTWVQVIPVEGIFPVWMLVWHKCHEVRFVAFFHSRVSFSPSPWWPSRFYHWRVNVFWMDIKQIFLFANIFRILRFSLNLCKSSVTFYCFVHHVLALWCFWASTAKLSRVT